jgi:FMN phosphatase YigB (HAD superfamily)
MPMDDHQLSKYKLFIFDLDGTLYDQRKLRRILLQKIFLGLISFKYSLSDLRIIQEFRTQREFHKGYASKNIETEQYQWCADALNLPLEMVRQKIEYFMLHLPLKHIFKTRYQNVELFFDLPRKLDIKTAIFSDYPIEEKMKSLKLRADYYQYSLGEDIAQLKPNSKALLKICNEMNYSPDEALFIGDRDDTDGASARSAGIDFIKVDLDQARKGIFFKELQKTIIPDCYQP